MLSSLHKTAASSFMKAFLVLIVASFAFWGIGDVFRSGSADGVIKVGSGYVSAQEFSDDWIREVANYRSILGESYKPELMQLMGVHNKVLEGLIQRRLVQEEAKSLGLVVPDAYLAEKIRNDQAFFGDDGTFDRATFNRVLTSNNLTEKRYLSLIGKDLLAATILQGALSGVTVTDAAAELAYRFESETRTADILIFPASLVKDIPAPTDEQLQAYYDEHADRFIAPELRSFSLIALDAEVLAKSINFSDEDLLVEYQKRIDHYQEPEKREVKQLLFDSEENARKAHEAIVSGSTLEKAGKKFGAINPDTLLGDVTASGVIPEAEKTVFGLKKDEYSDPIESSFGWHIFQVLNIQPKHTKPLKDVKDALIAELRAERLGNELYDLSSTLQDDLAGGVSITDAAKRVNATVQQFGPLDAEGKDANGKAVSLPEQYGELLSTAFTLSEGETSTILETKDGSYYAVTLSELRPSEQRPLEDVKATVTEEWKTAEKLRLLKAKTTEATEALKTGDAKQVAKASGAELIADKTLKRGNVDLGDGRTVPNVFISTLFTLKPGEITPAYQIGAEEFAIAKLERVIPADITTTEAKAGIENARQNLRVVYADEIYAAYMSYLRDKHGISQVNEALVNSIIQR